MQPGTEIKRRLPIPPWTVLLLQIVWLCTVVLAVHTGSAWHNLYHSVMTVTALGLVVGMFLRSRVALWGSGMIFAAAAGGTIARRLAGLGTGIGSDEADLFFVLALAVQAGGWVLHQTGRSLLWVRLEAVRPARLWFWASSALAFIAMAAALYHVLPQ